VYAIVQAASESEKLEVLAFLLDYFGYRLDSDTIIVDR